MEFVTPSVSVRATYKAKTQIPVVCADQTILEKLARSALLMVSVLVGEAAQAVVIVSVVDDMRVSVVKIAHRTTTVKNAMFSA